MDEDFDGMTFHLTFVVIVDPKKKRKNWDCIDNGTQRKRCIKTVGREIYHHLSSIIQALNTYIFF